MGAISSVVKTVRMPAIHQAMKFRRVGRAGSITSLLISPPPLIGTVRAEK
jgi:hypothetical protein